MSRQDEEWDDYFPDNDRWMTYPVESEHSRLKKMRLKRIGKCVIAAVIFAVAYCMHISQTSLSRWSDAAVSYTVDSWLDYKRLAVEVQPYINWVGEKLSAVKSVNK